mmetsp:Transcript_18636/g.40135  ORF Transcript_18636/g.40135 Transcript_18636/m.40135 type:complete len:127 (+) Transcript_18636:321-701(+)
MTKLFFLLAEDFFKALLGQFCIWVELDVDEEEANSVEGGLHAVSILFIALLGLLHGADRLRVSKHAVAVMACLAFIAPICEASYRVEADACNYARSRTSSCRRAIYGPPHSYLEVSVSHPAPSSSS